MLEVTIIPMIAASPHSHMGHRMDLGEKLKTLPGRKIVGLSNTPSVLTANERLSVIYTQWHDLPGIDFVNTDSAGIIAARARDYGEVLHILVGHDRYKKLGLGLKNSLEAGKIKEMQGRMFQRIEVHTPEQTRSEHGLSGTSMRQAIADANFDKYLEHYGAYDLAAEYYYTKILRPAYVRGELKVKRK